MSELKDKVGRALRLIGSGGWADEDPEVVAELLVLARQLADLVVADTAASVEAQAVAEDLLERLRSDTYGTA
ncbi:MAG TPA: hypothetical protein VGL20_05025 [Candidatus Dormibacteraeota bacterium]